MAHQILENSASILPFRTFYPICVLSLSDILRCCRTCCFVIVTTCGHATVSCPHKVFKVYLLLKHFLPHNCIVDIFLMKLLGLRQTVLFQQIYHF